MRRRKLKRKSKYVLFKLLLPAVILPMILAGLYYFFPTILNRVIVSPLARLSSKHDNKTLEDSLKRNDVGYLEVKTATDSSYLINLLDGGVAIITPKKNIETQISSLQLMINRLTIEGKRIKVVDFRYDRPIVRL